MNTTASFDIEDSADDVEAVINANNQVDIAGNAKAAANIHKWLRDSNSVLTFVKVLLDDLNGRCMQLAASSIA